MHVRIPSVDLQASRSLDATNAPDGSIAISSDTLVHRGEIAEAAGICLRRTTEARLDPGLEQVERQLKAELEKWEDLFERSPLKPPFERDN